jgi:hypothetical protein
MPYGSSINDVTALGGRGFCDDSTKALVMKSVAMGEGMSKIIIYGRPHGLAPLALFVRMFGCTFYAVLTGSSSKEKLSITFIFIRQLIQF